MNAFTRIIAGVILSLVSVPTFGQVSMTDLSTENIVQAAEGSTPVGQQITEDQVKGEGASRPEDIGLAALTASAIEGAQHDNKCRLLVVVSPKEGINRDLGLVSVSDLAAGSRVETDNLVDEQGFAITVVGFEPVIQLTEANLFGSRVLISGKSMDDFTAKAQQAGYTVFTNKVACQAAVRQEDLASLANAVVKARKALRDLQD